MAVPSDPRDTLHSLFGELLRSLEALVPEQSTGASKDLLRRARQYYKTHGCNLTEGSLPPELYLQTCVLDEGKPWDCVFATRLDKEGRGKEFCKHWAGNRPFPRLHDQL